jgi:hypothetical protein
MAEIASFDTMINLLIRSLLISSLFVPAMTLSAQVSFDREVRPLLEMRCNECHHPEKQRGGLDLTRIETMRRGGDELGAAIVPGKPDESPLIQVLIGAKEPKMPEKGDPLSVSEIELLRSWIAEGAKDDSPVFASEDVAFFEKEIRPVLSNRCFKCHAGDDAEHGLRLTSRHAILSGGERGPAAVAGDAEASLLMKALRHDGDLQMPKNGDRLSETQIAAFARWIAQGLPWPAHESVLARERQFTISDADRQHWAFKPLPAVEAKWSIDSALKPHHDRIGLQPGEKADRYQLLRRVTYDLIGYPPTQEEIAAFAGDDAADAFEKVVTRLLDSPHFGWRWSRHWLDYTRAGSNAQSNRGPALDTERYASWVARCFNEDRPWDWFTQVHLAGDLMPALDGKAGSYSVDQALAAATPLNGPRTFEKIETQTFILMDKLDEGVEFLGRSLMGISLECARCHDHKFDPISQRDYYALLGFFQSSNFAPVPEDTTTREEAARAHAEFESLTNESARLYGLIRRAGLLNNVGGGGRVKAWQEKRVPELLQQYRRMLDLKREVLRAELTLAEKDQDQATIAGTRDALQECEAALSKNADTPTFDVRTMKHFHYDLGGHKDNIGLAKRAVAAHAETLLKELTAQDSFWQDEIQRWNEASKFGGIDKNDPAAQQIAGWDARQKEIGSTLPASLRALWEPPHSGWLYVRSEGGLRRDEDLLPFDKQAKEQGMMFNSDNAERAHWMPSYIGDARLLLRGDALYPADLVPRGTPVFFGEEKLELTGSGRLQLAQWLTSPDSIQVGLVSRAAANRAWQHLFGEALCRTPKELGRLGETPELPELLDGLASRFVQSGWSQKALVREIVLSAAYRRAATETDAQHEKDPRNRYFTRQNVRRLEVEPILNSMAWHHTGQRPEKPVERNRSVPAANEYAQHFDGPSPFDLIDRRSTSITATQALFLMNHPQTARSLADDILKHLGKAADARQVFEAVLQRPPTAHEVSLVAKFGSLRDFAAALLCSNEAIYLE